MKIFAISLFVTLLGTLLLTANPPCRVIYHSPSYVSPTYQQSYSQPTYQQSYNHHHRQIIRTVEIATVAQINPAYQSSYSPDGYDSATQADLLAEVRRLSALVALQNKILTSPMPPAKGDPAPKDPPARLPPPVGLTGIQVLNAKCAACHQAGKLAPEQRFTLLDAKGNLATLTAAQKARVLTKTYQGQMPPPTNTFGLPSVTDTEYGALVELMAGP